MSSRGADGEISASISSPEPIVVNDTAEASRFPLRVVAFNAHGGGSLEAIANRLSKPPLSDAGIILLCEAGWRVRMAGGREFPRELASMLGMNFAYVPEFGVADQSGTKFVRSIGNAILARGTLADVRSVPIAHFPRTRTSRLRGQPRGLLTTIRHGDVALTVGVVHLHSRIDPARRDRQMADYLRALPANGHAIIGGDLNTTTVGLANMAAYAKAIGRVIAQPRRLRYPQPFEPLFHTISEHGFALDQANVPGAPTFAASGLIPRAMRPKLDWIAVRGCRAVTGSAAVVAARDGLLGRRFSDHDFVVCDVVTN